jgi:hypothetical protein
MTPNILFVACNLPTGILMEIGEKGDDGYEMRLIKGANEGRFDRTGRFSHTTIGGYGMTEIDADFYYRWKAAYMNFALRSEKNKILTVHESREACLKFCEDHAHVRTGFEPLDPVKDMPKGLEAAPDGPNEKD